VTKKRLIQENKSLKEQVAQKDLIISKLQKMLFGPKSERFVKQEIPPNQPSLFDKDEQQQPKQTPQDKQEEKQKISYERTRPVKKNRQTGRIPLPQDLPRVRIVIQPEEDVSSLIKIGEEVTEVLDIIPPQFRVIQIVRPKYAKPEAKTGDVENPILIAPLPHRLIAPLPHRVIDKGIPSSRLLAYIIISKFVNHLPYYRQIEMFKRTGVDIKSTTINGWIAKVCVLLKPLYDAFCTHH